MLKNNMRGSLSIILISLGRRMYLPIFMEFDGRCEFWRKIVWLAFLRHGV